MRGLLRDPLRTAVNVVMAATMTTASIPLASPALAAGPMSLPDCGATRVAGHDDGRVVEPWRAILDAEGAVTEHRLTLRRRGADTTVRTGRRGFAVRLDRDRILVGERHAAGTDLVMVDAARGCRLWERALDRLAYDIIPDSDGRRLRLALHEPATRAYQGQLILESETGASNAMVEGDCSSGCAPNDGELDPAAFGPVAVARPVPAFPAGGWAPGKTLTYRWRAGDVPPKWARPPLRRGAADATTSGIARNPVFVLKSSATNTVRYTSAFPTFCRLGIACASRAMPAWSVWIRPEGTDFSWGTLRWCQRRNVAGCFDLRRVMLHELGHVSGLNHPSSAGFRLAPHETVMHGITPARPKPNSSRHSYGRCDVATLQELYDVPNKKAPISSCNDVKTGVTLSSDKRSVAPGGSVRLVAVLRVVDRADYGLLGGNRLNGRSVKLKYRRAGSSAPWSTAWMKPLAAAGRYASTMSPKASWEFKAVFPAPTDEGLRYSRSGVLKVKVRS